VEKSFSDSKKGIKIKAIRTDGGGEYSTGEFQRELKWSGIESQVTVPYTPQENEVSENSNRLLVERANTLIQHAAAPMGYWAEALQAMVHLKNVSLTRGHTESMLHHISHGLNGSLISSTRECGDVRHTILFFQQNAQIKNGVQEWRRGFLQVIRRLRNNTGSTTLQRDV